MARIIALWKQINSNFPIVHSAIANVEHHDDITAPFAKQFFPFAPVYLLIAKYDRRDKG
jgi:hypothetical protein